MYSRSAILAVFFFLLTSSFAFQTQPNHARLKVWTNDSPLPVISTNTPGTLRRRLVGEATPKISLPLPLISAIVAALKGKDPVEATQVFFQTLFQEQSRNDFLPISYKPFSELSFVDDCISAQRQLKLNPLPPFLLELSPAMCNIGEDDRQRQSQWLQENAARLRDLKISHGGIYFRSWSLFTDPDGVSEAWTALGLTPCRDPKEIRGPTPLLDGSSTIYETLNSPQDAETHLGLHSEGIPGIMPMSALFSCFQEAESGGEFLLCDGRRVVRDLDTQTLANLERKKLRPTFAELPDWIATSPLSFLPYATEIHREILALFTDMTKPTDDFFLDVFPEMNKTQSLKLTTYATAPVLKHPLTGEPVWFSGMDAGHKGNFLKDNPHISGVGKYASEVFDVRYGDGTEISETDLGHVREACQRNTRALAMRPGDAVLLDNFTTLHGRKPFVGTRRHAVVWFLD